LDPDCDVVWPLLTIHDYTRTAVWSTSARAVASG
jgi:hypothetical protein